MPDKQDNTENMTATELAAYYNLQDHEEGTQPHS